MDGRTIAAQTAGRTYTTDTENAAEIRCYQVARTPGHRVYQLPNYTQGLAGYGEMKAKQWLNNLKKRSLDRMEMGQRRGNELSVPLFNVPVTLRAGKLMWPGKCRSAGTGDILLRPFPK